jgi:hypothetical protein
MNAKWRKIFGIGLQLIIAFILRQTLITLLDCYESRWRDTASAAKNHNFQLE